MIEEELKERKLPELLKFNNGGMVKNKEDWENRRKEIKKILNEEEYGYFPKEHVPISVQILEEDINGYCGGTAIFRKILLTLNFEKEKFSFPVQISIPKKDKPCPAFLYISFYDSFPNKYLPVEEISDGGFAVISFCYKDITLDNNDFTNGLSKFFYKNENQRDFGKILLWSWAAMHVMDYIQTLDGIDKDNIAIVGHSRLGKTALLTGAFDERFKYTISNDSGQSGAAISRKKVGENIKCICERFSYWFCSNYKKYSNNEEMLPFDQHYLLSLVAPRNLYVASASKDTWADPKSEFLCCTAINPVYALYNKKGLVYNDEYPISGTKLLDGDIGYHFREGCHYLSRYDWNTFMKYINKNK